MKNKTNIQISSLASESSIELVNYQYRVSSEQSMQAPSMYEFKDCFACRF